MKRVEVGNFRVLLNDRGVVIDKVWTEGPNTFHRQITAEHGELADLLVALDGVSNDLPPLDRERSALSRIEEIMREAAHKLAVLGIRTRIEFHVDFPVLYDLAYNADREPERDERRRDIGKISLGVGCIVAQRGRYV